MKPQTKEFKITPGKGSTMEESIPNGMRSIHFAGKREVTGLQLCLGRPSGGAEKQGTYNGVNRTIQGFVSIWFEWENSESPQTISVEFRP